MVLMKTLKEITNEYMLVALKFHNFNRTHTAKALGISIRTLRNYINALIQEGRYQDLLNAPIKGRTHEDRVLNKLFPTNEQRLYYKDKFPNNTFTKHYRNRDKK